MKAASIILTGFLVSTAAIAQTEQPRGIPFKSYDVRRQLVMSQHVFDATDFCGVNGRVVNCKLKQQVGAESVTIDVQGLSNTITSVNGIPEIGEASAVWIRGRLFFEIPLAQQLPNSVRARLIFRFSKKLVFVAWGLKSDEFSTELFVAPNEDEARQLTD